MIARFLCHAVFPLLVAVAGCASHDDNVHSNTPANPPQDEPTPDFSSANLVEGAPQLCFEAAKHCAAVALKKDTEAIADCMPDDFVRALGGRQVVMTTIRKVYAEVDAAGVTMEDTRVSPPTAIARGDGHVYAIVPETVIGRFPQGRGIGRSYLLGVSSDDGRTWRFVDGIKLTRPLVLKFFPDFPATLELPVVGKPVLIKQ